MRRFETPVGPPGWVGMGAELLRIVDPTGRAIAWLAPGFGANCVAYAVRRDDPAPGHWQQLFRTGNPRALRTHPLDHGCAILGPEPAGDGTAHLSPWRFVERDPTAATCSAHRGSLRLDLTASLEDAALHLDLVATNAGPEAAPSALGLRLSLAAALSCDISPRGAAQLSLADRDNPALRLTIALIEGQGGSLRADSLAGGEIVVEAHSANAPGDLIAPDTQLRLGVIVAPI